MSKKEWIIRMMQGMVCGFGSRKMKSECWYNGEAFRTECDGHIADLDMNWVNPTHEFWIIDRKGIPEEDFNLCNLD